MSEVELKPPLYFWEPADLLAFRTVEDAEKYFEVEDVRRNQLGLGFDSNGVMVRARLTEDWLPKVKLFADSKGCLSMDEQRAIFVEFLEACGSECAQSASLDLLVGEALRLAATR